MKISLKERSEANLILDGFCSTAAICSRDVVVLVKAIRKIKRETKRKALEVERAAINGLHNGGYL